MDKLNIFIKEGCPACDHLCKQLDENRIPYNKIDTETDILSRAKLIASGKTELPVIEHKNKLIDYMNFMIDILPNFNIKVD